MGALNREVRSCWCRFGTSGGVDSSCCGPFARLRGRAAELVGDREPQRRRQRESPSICRPGLSRRRALSAGALALAIAVMSVPRLRRGPRVTTSAGSGVGPDLPNRRPRLVATRSRPPQSGRSPPTGPGSGRASSPASPGSGVGSQTTDPEARLHGQHLMCGRPQGQRRRSARVGPPGVIKNHHTVADLQPRSLDRHASAP